MKNDSIDNIRLDINRQKLNACVSVRYGDTKTRSLHCMLVNNGSLISLENAIFAELLISKADGREADQNMVIYGNELQYTWRTQDVNAIGKNICQIMVTFEDGSVITSPEFSLYVYTKVIEQSMQESMNEYTAITQQLVETKKYASEAEISAKNAEDSENASKNTYERLIQKSEEYIAHMDEILLNAQDSEDGARIHEENAKKSEDDAKEQAQNASNTMNQIVEITKKYLSDIAACKSEMDVIKGRSEEYAIEAKDQCEKAKGYAIQADSFKNSAYDFSQTAGLGAELASKAADNANTSKGQALEYADEAKAAADGAYQSELKADEYQKKAKEYLDQFGEGNLTLGETADTAYRGDRGKEAYDHANTPGNPHGTSYEDVGADRAGAASGALAEAKSYVDTKNVGVLSDSKDYTDDQMAASYQNATAYTDRKIAELINGAPETLDTLKEIADAMEEHEEVVEALNEAIGTKANASEVKSHEDNSVIHVTASEREKWNEITQLKSRVEQLMDMIGYPYNPGIESEE